MILFATIYSSVKTTREKKKIIPLISQWHESKVLSVEQIFSLPPNRKEQYYVFFSFFLFFFLHIYLFLIQPFVVFLYIDTTHWMNSKVMHAPKNTEWYICMARVWNAPIILEESASTSACLLRTKLLHSPLSLSTQPRSNGSSKVTLIFFIFL